MSIPETLRKIEREQGTILERVEGVREDVADLKRDVAELKAQKERGKGWIAGALAAAAIALQALGWMLRLVPLVLLGGCVGPNGADTYWHDRLKPVKVFVHEEMRPECIQSVKDALDFWADQGVDYLEFRRASASWSGFYGIRGPAGTISVRDGTLPPGHAGTTWDMDLFRRMRSARIRLSVDTQVACEMEVVAHEIGHALGLEHSPSGLMNPDSLGDLSLTDHEIDWVTQ